jgi:hypothetical protein
LDLDEDFFGTGKNLERFWKLIWKRYHVDEGYGVFGLREIGKRSEYGKRERCEK